MLNRSGNPDLELGRVRYIIPTDYHGTFGQPSAHDFDEFQIDEMGSISFVSAMNPMDKLMETGKQIAELVRGTLDEIRLKPKHLLNPLIVVANPLWVGLVQAALIGAAKRSVAYIKFKREYKVILQRLEKIKMTS